jgi:hypothetical protein
MSPGLTRSRQSDVHEKGVGCVARGDIDPPHGQASCDASERRQKESTEARASIAIEGASREQTARIDWRRDK